MKQFKTSAFVLRRVDYGETDRIITFLTPKGQVSVIAKGVRRPRSKLAGGIELFSESEISVIEGKGRLDILRSARLLEHFYHLAEDYDRLRLAYYALGEVERLTREGSEAALVYTLLKTLMSQLDRFANLGLSRLWFILRLLDIHGHKLNLVTDIGRDRLQSEKRYRLNVEEASLEPDRRGIITGDIIKTWRLLNANLPRQVERIQGTIGAASTSLPVAERFYSYYLGKQ